MFKTGQVIVFIFFVLSGRIHADIKPIQSDKKEVSLTFGTFLPSSMFYELDNNYSMWGGSFYLPTSVWNFEFQALTAREHGVIYHSASIGLRKDFAIEDIIEIFLLGGLDFHRYKAVSEFKNATGFHLGFGGFLPVSDNFKFRAELKFHNGPGTSIYVGLGPAILF